jgi:hypothetical protein
MFAIVICSFLTELYVLRPFNPPVVTMPFAADPITAIFDYFFCMLCYIRAFDLDVSYSISKLLTLA